MCKCVWCKESFERSELLREKDMGLLCHNCFAAIKSHGEPLEVIYE